MAFYFEATNVVRKIWHINSLNEPPAEPASYAIERRLFEAVDAKNNGYVFKQQLIDQLHKLGITENHIGFQSTMKKLTSINEHKKIPFEAFVELTRDNLAFLEKALTGGFVIPNFEVFCSSIEDIYQHIRAIKSGKLANYIPQLARVDPNAFSVSLCTVDGQSWSIGDTDAHFSAQSTCKPINYCLVQKEHGTEKVHRYIGKESSGHGFNVLHLNKENIPHNPFINAGALMACSLLGTDLDPADRFDYVMQAWTDMAGGLRPGFNNAVYLSELNTSNRNFAIAYFMQENNAFPKNTNIIDILEFYFQCCSIEVTTRHLAVVAATLANAGVCPLTQKEVFNPETVKNCLSLMSSCGLYDFSGEYAFTVGIPAKSSVSGAIMLVVPNVLGLCIYSPPLDEYGNSVKGVAFSKALVDRYNFHNYDSLIRSDNKEDPRRFVNEVRFSPVMSLIWAASQGDLMEIQRLIALGIDINKTDYDGRTALHLAASEGQLPVVNYILLKGGKVNPIDRWGGTPLADARRGNHEAVVQSILEHGGKYSAKEIMTPILEKNPAKSCLSHYEPFQNSYDEYFSAKNKQRPALKPFFSSLESYPLHLMQELHNTAKQSFKDRGISFKVYTQKGSHDGIFPFDLLPRIVAANEWKKVEQGLEQRLKALNCFLQDIYSGQKILKNKRIPEQLIQRCAEFYPALKGKNPSGDIHAHIAGCDLVRNHKGELLVLEDNLRTPSGVSYLLENRNTMKTLVPEWFSGLNIHDVDMYPKKLYAILQSFVSEHHEPLIVVLTPGIYNSAYFEHQYLAKRMGCPLVENSDLFVEKNKVYWHSPNGKKRVDVIYKRTDDSFIDPTFFRKDSLLGIPGIVEAYKAKEIVIANALGNGVADDKGIYPFVPEMIKYYLGEDIILPQVETWSGANPKDYAYILAHLDKLVVKLVNQSGGYGMLIGPQASRQELEDFRQKIKNTPDLYIAQPLVEISTIPTLQGERLHPHRVDWRVYVLSGRDNTWVLPGGLTRVALREGSYVVNSSQGGGSKDTWVMKPT